jgi:D-amino peptidase
VLSHTYNPRAVWEVRLNGIPVGESALNSLVALHHGVPVTLITGDQSAVNEAAPFLPEIEGVIVKRSVTRYAAESLHPRRACALIHDGACRASARAGRRPLPTIEFPATLEVTFLTADMAEMSSWVDRVQRVAARTVSFTDDDPLRIYRTVVQLIMLTRALVEC